ncbi:MAG TPA: PIG-L family deacetylase [Bryobacteraceae bacterium]|nr:PIG-L family deacetylase [Bryobacteraceae bacterium]
MKSILRLVLYAAVHPLSAQPSGSAEIQLNLQMLNTTGSVLMIAAHPDDENTNLLAYFARGRSLRTGYLSLTRGEGGQNLIGPEQGSFLGLIRTQELLAARRIDGAEQFFTRAIDFGFSKTAEETLSKWGRERILSDVVWIIRSYRPDIIILRYSGTSKDGHGHHQSSAILGKEAFTAAADPARFPEQLQYVKPWTTRRLYFNLFAFTPEHQRANALIKDKLEVEAGELNPVLGQSYGEIAGRSRSRHASQGMGAEERRGSIRDHLVLIAGEPAAQDPMEGIDVTWQRMPGGSAVAPLLAEALKTFEPSAPHRIVPLLLRARSLIAAMPHPEAQRKLRELDETIGLASGLWVDAAAGAGTVTPGSAIPITLSMVRRLPAAVSFVAATLHGAADSPKGVEAATALPYNLPVQHKLIWVVPAAAATTQPFWLAKPGNGLSYAIEEQRLIGPAENAPILSGHFRFKTAEGEFTLIRPVQHRYVDSVRGELTRPLLIVSPISVELADATVIFPDVQPRTIPVTVKANQEKAAGRLRLQAPAGWKIAPVEAAFELPEVSQQATISFTVTPPSEEGIGILQAVGEVHGQRITVGERVISYPHIPPQTVFIPATARLIRSDIRITSRRIGYITGAGDSVPEALRQLGVSIALLGDEELAAGDLSRYGAILTGVRAFNTRPALRANFQRLLDYMSNGGTLVVQYNVMDRSQPATLLHLGPYPIELSSSRITVEEAPVLFPDPAHPLLAKPNRITEKDFEGWVQERGLYFPSKWDPRYQPLFSSRDPGEDWLPGGTLYAKYGKGAYVYTSYSWFRQLPAGVPGAYRIFANLLSAGK